MALTATPGGKVRVTVTKKITRAQAFKTLERLFMTCKVASGPIKARSANFKEQPKRRGGTIWTKRPNKVHLGLEIGSVATIKSTPQHVRDLNSVADFVEVASA